MFSRIVCGLPCMGMESSSPKRVPLGFWSSGSSRRLLGWRSSQYTTVVQSSRDQVGDPGAATSSVCDIGHIAQPLLKSHELDVDHKAPTLMGHWGIKGGTNVVLGRWSKVDKLCCYHCSSSVIDDHVEGGMDHLKGPIQLPTAITFMALWKMYWQMTSRMFG